MASTKTTDVVIAGAGPTGLMLALELRLAGIDVTLVDALPERSGESRAGGIHARTMELLDQRGLLAPLLERGRVIQAGHFGGLRMSFGDFPTRFPYMLGLVQSEIERELDARARDAGAPVHWGSPVVGLAQDGTGVEVELGGEHPRRVRAAYLVGCDGGRSAVRKLAGIGFPGTESTVLGMLADVQLADPPEDMFFGARRGPGDYSAIQLQPGSWRLIVQRHDRVHERGAEPTFDDFRRSFTEVAGTDFGMHDPIWFSHYGDAARLADRYRDGRVLLAGDAAHIHYPAGGQGLNTGVQDAVNLGWKLAAAVRGDAPAGLLDSYGAERRPVGERVLHSTRAQTQLMRPGVHADALRDVLGDLLGTDEVRHRLGLMIAALDLRYETGCDHPLAGRRVPDADLRAPGGETRIAELLRSGRPVLLALRDADALEATAKAWLDQVVFAPAESVSERWPLPGHGECAAPAGVLIRPDGYAAWAGEAADADGLRAALTRWVGTRPGLD
jgi:2-polyprenyl-6-methoxyphenol hydroxylase-like FAD-dependent oxidoreductase